MSHLLQMRGLKQSHKCSYSILKWSHLLQMRGLKLNVIEANSLNIIVASFTDAWIETSTPVSIRFEKQSHLLQMRGLKRLI